jgi:GT2 family glycosyltransferase
MIKYRVNITVVTHNRISLTQKCLNSLVSKTPKIYSLTVIDNNSTDGTIEYSQYFFDIGKIDHLYFLKRNMGVSVAANLGWCSVKSDYYVKLDNDIEILDSNWLSYLVSYAEKYSHVATIGYKLCDWHETTCIELDKTDRFLKFEGCGGGCVLVPQHIHEILGFWNEDYGTYGFEDLEYGNRAILKKFLTGYHPNEDVVMHHGVAERTCAEIESKKRRNLQGKRSGQELYLLNKFMFENNLRDIFVQRKYLANHNGQEVSFELNPSYKPILRMQQFLRNRITFNVSGDIIRVDLNNFIGECA